MTVTLLIWVCALLVHAHAGVPFASDRTNQKQVDAVCILRDDNSMLMQMSALFGGNHVDKVLALPGPNFDRFADGSTNEVPCQYSGNIQTDDGIHLESVVYLNGAPGLNECGARPVFSFQSTTNVIGYEWFIQIRENFTIQVYTNIDRTYRIQCLLSDAMTNYVTASVQVYQAADRTGSSVPVRPTNILSVVTRNNRVNLGAKARLRVETLQEVALQANVHPYGSHIFYCDYRLFLGGQRSYFIDESGCPITGNVFRLQNGFKFARYVNNAFGRRGFQTETDEFVMARVRPRNDIFYFTCYLNYCFGNENSDSKCTDYCLYNQNLGRKKRSIVTESDQVTLAVRIYSSNETEVETLDDEKTGSSLDSTMIAVVSVVAVLFVILSIFAAFVLLYICRRRNTYEEDQSSASGSNSNLPRHLKEAHIRPTKA